jgi:hypothetical protein
LGRLNRFFAPVKMTKSGKRLGGNQYSTSSD